MSRLHIKWGSRYRDVRGIGEWYKPFHRTRSLQHSSSSSGPAAHQAVSQNIRDRSQGRSCQTCRWVMFLTRPPRWAVGTDHLPRLSDLSAAGTTRAGARSAVARRANQSVTIVTFKALLTGCPGGEIRTIARAWWRGGGGQTYSL